MLVTQSLLFETGEEEKKNVRPTILYNSHFTLLQAKS